MTELEGREIDDLLADNEVELDLGADFDEDALLGTSATDVEKAVKVEPDSVTETTQPEDDEQLDYDEDIEEEKAPREKFTSEKNPEQNKPASSVKTTAPSTTTSTRSHSKPSAGKCYVNPNFRGRFPFPVGPTGPPLPSLMMSGPFAPPPHMGMRPPPPMMGGGMAPPMLGAPPLMNRPPMPLMARPMHSLSAGAMPTMPPMRAGFAPPMPPPPLQQFPMAPLPPHQPQLAPMQMPNPSLLLPPGPNNPITNVQHNPDGSLTFRAKIPALSASQQKVTVVRAGLDQRPKDSWDNNVEDFLRKTTTNRKRAPSSSRSRSRSVSSRSRSYSSSRSASGSFSDYSRSSYSRSRSKSPTPPPRKTRRRSPVRRHRTEPRRERERRRRPSPRRNGPAACASSSAAAGGRGGRGADHRGSRPRAAGRRDPPRSRHEDALRNTIECAEAIGLDQDYVKMLEEQKRLREDLARKKYKRNGGADADKPPRPAASSKPDRRPDSSRDAKEQRKTAAARQAEQKLKPYLAVVIHNLNNLSDAYKRVKLIANAVGPTKKVWQTSDDSVSVIFEAHEHAKAFMLQYHMKPYSGVTLDIGLEKVFLNLSSIP